MRFDTETFLEVAESAARGTKTVYDDDDEYDAHCIECFDYVASTARYWQSKACSTTWNQGFTDRVKRAVAVSFPTLNESEKELLRCSSGRCMACGRNEEKNFTAISFFGSKPTQCFQNIHDLADDYENLQSGINDVFEFAENVANTSKWRGKQNLFYSDGGTYIVGETCLRRAKLAYMAGNFISEACYSVSVHINDMKHNKQKISDKHFYCCGDEDAKLFNDSWDEMMRLCSKETEEIDDDKVPIDQEYWKAARKIRSYAFKDRHSMLGALSSRAKDVSHDSVCDDAWYKKVSGGDSLDLSVTRSKSFVVADSDDSGEEEEDSVIIPSSRPKRPRASSVAKSASQSSRKAPKTSTAASSSASPTAPLDSSAEMITGLLGVKDFLKMHGENRMAVCVMEAVMALQK